MTVRMFKILKAIVLGVYCALVIHLITITLYNSDGEIIEMNYIIRTPGTLKKIVKEIKNLNKNLTTVKTKYKRPSRLPTDFKYILKWTHAFSQFDSPIFRHGQKVCLDFNCTYNNCYITNDRSVLVDMRHFDAIIYDVENTWDLPPYTISHQINIFTSTYAASSDPVCDNSFENFFHLTWTYKLDSDLPSPYFTISDKEKNIIGPSIDMMWLDPMAPAPEYVVNKLRDKKKAVAWFSSNCNSIERGIVINKLVNALNKVHLYLDIYGACGNLTCPKDRMKECEMLLEKKYYFYLAFENTVSEDYVTDIILPPLLHYSVPIVYGGADYSRYLPPGSYIDAGKLESDEVVDLILKAIETPSIYQDYFRWHNHYEYKESQQGADVCQLCHILNTRTNFTTARNFRKWWNPNYENMCFFSAIKKSPYKF